jgi:hypothetical protein
MWLPQPYRRRSAIPGHTRRSHKLATITIVIAQFDESRGPKGDSSIGIPGIDQMSLRFASRNAFHDIRMGQVIRNRLCCVSCGCGCRLCVCLGCHCIRIWSGSTPTTTTRRDGTDGTANAVDDSPVRRRTMTCTAVCSADASRRNTHLPRLRLLLLLRHDGTQ